eukprot:scaffold6786_cov384-Prasinococcus_capsulatus_cf.AAC.8
MVLVRPRSTRLDQVSTLTCVHWPRRDIRALSSTGRPPPSRRDGRGGTGPGIHLLLLDPGIG